MIISENMIAVFGLGYVGKWFINEIGVERIEFIVDNNPILWNTTWNGIEVISPENFIKRKSSIMVVISAPNYEKEIVSQLNSYGYANYCLFTELWINEKINLNKTDRHLFLMNTHTSTNVGDFAIIKAERLFFKRYFPDIDVIEVPALICEHGITILKQCVDRDDVITITGGGYIGSLWMYCGESAIRKIITAFPDNKVVLLPNTIYFSDDEYGKNELNTSISVYNKHKNLTICLRDRNSYEIAQKIFSKNIHFEYIPDMVLFMDHSNEVFRRDGVTVCFRDDKESMISSSFKEKIKSKIIENGIITSEMTMHSSEIPDLEHIDDIVDEKLKIVQKSKVVLTDRLHCMLLCAISGTPCIAFNNLTGKVKGVYEWISYLPYINVIDPEYTAEKHIEEFLICGRYYYDNKKLISEYEKLSKLIID